jgi:D-3-phosphoglycerate dehydrogenase
MRVLLLENIHPIAKSIFEKNNFQKVDLLKHSLSEEELIETLKNYDALGIRSKTQITRRVLEANPHLQAIGCFCIGTNQVDLKATRQLGIAVFNAPFSNTRSVAEMTISNIISLARKIAQRSQEMHQGQWNKESENCFEVRGKTLGIVGYGNIGTQVSMLAESLGLRVLFYDIVAKLPLGNARAVSSLEDLLKESDFVTIHVPETPQTKNLFSKEKIALMKEGSYLLNASRGTVVDLDALSSALKNKKLLGAAIDVFPEEPEKKNAEFKCVLQGIPNVILTPHIGGATEEAQVNIGIEVSNTLIRFLNFGATQTAVNFPRVDLAPTPNSYRIINIHKNVPGVLKEINRVISEQGANILSQALATDPELGYVVMDLNEPLLEDSLKKLNSIKNSIQTRQLTNK